MSLVLTLVIVPSFYKTISGQGRKPIEESAAGSPPRGRPVVPGKGKAPEAPGSLPSTRFGVSSWL
jgi:hypothetical protein